MRKLNTIMGLVSTVIIATFIWLIIPESDDAQEKVVIENNDSLQIDEGNTAIEEENGDYYVDDSIYYWDEEIMYWVAEGLFTEPIPNVIDGDFDEISGPTKVDWETLLAIKYRLRYFKSKDIEMFSPVFTDALLALDGKEVIIKGHVIPFDEEGEMLALSATTYSSCYFCGNASPASIISMFMQDTEKEYILDEYRSFKGILKLNHNDPDQFYYVLEDVIQIDG